MLWWKVSVAKRRFLLEYKKKNDMIEDSLFMSLKDKVNSLLHKVEEMWRNWSGQWTPIFYLLLFLSIAGLWISFIMEYVDFSLRLCNIGSMDVD